jgi:hypothetical protein
MAAKNPAVSRFVPLPRDSQGRLDRTALDTAIAHGFCIVQWHPTQCLPQPVDLGRAAPHGVIEGDVRSGAVGPVWPANRTGTCGKPADQQRVFAGKYQWAGLRVAAACLAAELSRVSASATAPARVVAAELGAIPRAPHSNGDPGRGSARRSSSSSSPTNAATSPWSIGDGGVLAYAAYSSAKVLVHAFSVRCRAKCRQDTRRQRMHTG